MKEISTAKQVMLYLAEHGPANRWKLKLVLKKSYGNIHLTISNLKEKKLIESTATEHTARNPEIEVENYAVTDAGIFVLLYELDEKELDAAIDRIAERQKEWSMIFEKWSLFKEAGLRPTILYYLKKTVDAGVDAMGEMLALRRGKLSKLELAHELSKYEYSLKTKIEQAVLMAPISNKNAEFAKLYKQDEDLKQFISLGIEANIKLSLAHLALWKDVKDWWKPEVSVG